jgi:hypothetical protein
MSIDSQIFETFVPVYDAVPENWEDARPFVVEQLKKISNALNIREVGWYIDEEVLSGKAFIPGDNSGGGATNQVFRQVFRKVIDFGTLPNATTKSVPHGITVTNDFTLVFMGAYATDPVNLVAIPIPFTSTVALANQISMFMDATNVTITTGSNNTNYTRCFVTIEYLLES